MEMKERTLSVEGVAKIRTEPDQAVVCCVLSVFDPSYSNASTELQRLVGLLRDQLETLGFKRTDLKTRYSEVRRETARHSQEYHPRLLGFKAVSSMELRLPLDRELLNRVVEAFQQSGANPEVEVEFSVSDPEALQARVLAAAVENARDRAETMVHAAGVKLGPLLNIQYLPRGNHNAGHAVSGEAQTAGPENESGEFIAQDRVLMSWEIL